MKKWFELGPFTIFDLETTGMSPVNDRIVELAAIRVDQDGKQERFHSLINPGRPIPNSATRIHHISDAMVSDAPNFSELGIQFTDFAMNSCLIAHNARFDLGFLQESLARTGRKVWQGRTMDSIPLIRKAFPGLNSYSLQNLRHHFGLGEGDAKAHRAFNDVEWTLEMMEITFKKLLLMTGE